MVNWLLKDPTSSANICSFAFSDLAARGQFDLVASVDFSGREFCNRVVVISQENDSFNIQDVPAWQVNDVASTIRRLDASSRPQLVIPEALSDYESGPDCVATWQRIYAFQGDRLVDVSTAFPDYYRERGTILEKELGGAAGSSISSTDANGTDCRLMELDKTLRLLREPQNAGFERASIWMTSVDPSLRRKAIRVFADIDDEPSLKKLALMAKDSDPFVAERAQTALSKLQTQRTQ